MRPIPSLTLKEVVDEYFLASFNDNRKYYPNYLSAAMWVWKDLLKDTIWSVVNKYIKIDHDQSPFKIPIPKDSIRLINVSVEDSCGNLQPLTIDNYINVLTKPVPEKKCGSHKEKSCSDSMCDAIDSISVRLKDVIIDGQKYTEKIWNKRLSNGDIMEIREVPVKEFDQSGYYTIVIDVREKFICHLDTNASGCIPRTDKNVKLLATHCGCFISSCMEESCPTDLQKTHNNYGKIKIEDGHIYIFVDSEYAIITYQTNGTCSGDNVLIPEIAVPAMLAGIASRTIQFRPNISINEKRSARIFYNGEKDELYTFLNPIRPDEFIRQSWMIPKWGGTNCNTKKHLPSQRKEYDSDGNLIKAIGEMMDEKLIATNKTININQQDQWDSSQW